MFYWKPKSLWPVEKMKTKILIVEDDALNMQLLNDLLQAHGYETLQEVSGSGVVQMVKEKRPDLILMDIQLPVISGLELTKILKEDEELKEIPIVAVTAFALNGDEEKIRKGGCDGYIAKPFSISCLLETIAKLLDSHE